MKKKYEVYMDLTITVTIDVHADNEEQAKKIAIEGLDANESYFISKYDSLIEREVTDVHESEDDDDDLGSEELKEAMVYVRQELGEDRLAVIRAQATVCMEQRRPVDTDCNDEVHDLLEEWGEEHDLCEEWWSESIELEDIIARL